MFAGGFAFTLHFSKQVLSALQLMLFPTGSITIEGDAISNKNKVVIKCKGVLQLMLICS